MDKTAVLAAHDEGEMLWFFGMLVEFRVTAEQSGGQFSLTEQQGRHGTATPLHRQPADDETFYVLDGELRFYLDDGEPAVAGPGATAYIPAGTVHAFDVFSETARWLNLTTPNHEAFFRAAAEPATARTLPAASAPDMPKLMAAAEQYSVEIVGPPPGKQVDH